MVQPAGILRFCGVAIERASAKLSKDLTFSVILLFLPVIRRAPSWPPPFEQHRRCLFLCQGGRNTPRMWTIHQCRKARLVAIMKIPDNSRVEGKTARRAIHCTGASVGELTALLKYSENSIWWHMPGVRRSSRAAYHLMRKSGHHNFCFRQCAI